MTQTILIIIGIAIVVILLTRKTREQVVGICVTALDQTVRKNTNKKKALEFIGARKEASNEDIREHLGISRRSAVRYLDELEREDKVEQMGDIGRGVTYRLK